MDDITICTSLKALLVVGDDDDAVNGAAVRLIAEDDIAARVSLDVCGGEETETTATDDLTLGVREGHLLKQLVNTARKAEGSKREGIISECGAG